MADPTDATIARPVRARRWGPAILLAAVLLAVVAGGRAVGGSGDAPATLAIGAVRLAPAAGWDLVRADASSARLHRGSAVLDVVAAPPAYTGPSGVAEAYVERVLEPSLAQLRLGEPAAATIAGGVPAVRVGYVGVTRDGVAIEGVIVAASGSRAAIVFDAAAPQGTLATVAGDVGAMIDSVVIAP